MNDLANLFFWVATPIFAIAIGVLTIRVRVLDDILKAKESTIYTLNRWMRELYDKKELAREKHVSTQDALKRLITAVEASRDSSAYAHVTGYLSPEASYELDDAIDHALITLGKDPLYSKPPSPLFLGDEKENGSSFLSEEDNKLLEKL
jgi:hypothetical protein